MSSATMNSPELKPCMLKHAIRGLSETFRVEHLGAEIRIRVERDRIAPDEPARVQIQAGGEFGIGRTDDWYAILHNGSRLLFRVRYNPLRHDPGRFEAVFIAPRSWSIGWDHHTETVPR